MQCWQRVQCQANCQQFLFSGIVYLNLLPIIFLSELMTKDFTGDLAKGAGQHYTLCHIAFRALTKVIQEHIFGNI